MKLPKILAVTFDMDGLMFNTEDLYDHVGSVLLARRGHQFTQELKLKTMGLPGPKSFEVLQLELGLTDTFESFQRDTDEIFAEILPTKLQKMAGLDRLLDLLESQNIPKALATSSHREFAETALAKFDLQRRFEFLLTRDDVVHGKPHPDIYLAAAAKLNIQPRQMLALEDSVIGSTSAVAAGAYTIAIPTVHSQHQDFSHANCVARSLEDHLILRLFDSR